ncbi:MAG TPA: beta-ketoacyl-ACP synthase III [Kofleriaceae bacterium]|nr:beta-ketoacyl-ACP synthase III [Kofleriaceae bacterium]
MSRITTGTAITGSGVWHPDTILTNDELVVAFNEFVRRDNAKHADEIAAGTREPLKDSGSDWIVKASGIKRRYVEDKTGLSDPERMCPNIKDRPEDQISIQAEYAVNAAKLALAQAGRTGEDVDLVVLGASNLQRLYPAIAIEVQDAIGARGYGFDVSIGCSAATGATIMAQQALQTGSARCALVVIPELTTGHMNWRERDSHFIFGDASVAFVVEPRERAKPGAWEILSSRMMSKWSSNIRNNAGYLDRCDPSTQLSIDKLFHQNGRRVFKDVVPLAAKFITEHLQAHNLAPAQIGRYWLHQANQKLNELVAEYVLGRPATRVEAPIILDEYGNTASAGSLIAFSHYNTDLPAGTYGILSSFGAGYSLASLLLQRI